MKRTGLSDLTGTELDRRTTPRSPEPPAVEVHRTAHSIVAVTTARSVGRR